MAECETCGLDPSGFWGCACVAEAAQRRVDLEPSPIKPEEPATPGGSR